MENQMKINAILDFAHNLPPEEEIPVELWIKDPAEVARRLNTTAQRMGIERQFSKKDIELLKQRKNEKTA